VLREYEVTCARTARNRKTTGEKKEQIIVSLGSAFSPLPRLVIISQTTININVSCTRVTTRGRRRQHNNIYITQKSYSYRVRYLRGVWARYVRVWYIPREHVAAYV